MDQKISIIIRTYNNGQFIRRCIESALAQDFTDYEIVVVNDGSTDSTKDILESFNDEKLNVIHQDNKGAIKSGYVGLLKSKGGYVIFLDGDDELKKTTLSDLYRGLTQDDAAFSYCDYSEVNLKNNSEKIVSCVNIFNTVACGILFRRSVLDEIGFWNKEFIFPEYDLLIRIMKKYKGVHVAKPLYIYNRHDSSFTADKGKVEEGKSQLVEKYGFIKGLFKEY